MDGKRTDGSCDLPRLRLALDSVLAACQLTGASAFRDLYLTVSGLHEGHEVGEISFARGRTSVRRPDVPVPMPDYVSTGDVANERALLLANLCYVMWHWELGVREVARFIDCPVAFVEDVIGDNPVDAVPELSRDIVERIRRLLLLDAVRITIGVSDDAVADWARAPQLELIGQSVLAVVIQGDQRACHRVALWLLGRQPPFARTLQ